MRFIEFKNAYKNGDFAIGDSFWLGNFNFEVKDSRLNRTINPNKLCLCCNREIDISRELFLRVIKDNHGSAIDGEEAFICYTCCREKLNIRF